ncbi:NADP-dependent oxidoreductase [Pedobacter sp. JCM 36344]|uniref:NADP-dependent oxidoreductase n=1 Tax=Pedobacter sp. JCM 36344 TaxID=3374280 RepID=UPI00397E2475
MNKVILLNNRPVGLPQLTDFKIIEENIPEPADGEVLLQTLYISVDPYLRGRMSDVKSYVPSFELNKPIQSLIIAKVTTSHHPDFEAGDFVAGQLPWKENQLSNGKGLSKVNPNAAPLSAYLGLLGMTGLTAQIGLTQIGKPKEGETIVVSGAAGAVGSIVGQIGKIMGCHVVGIAGTDEKVALLKSKFGFDDAINYKTTTNMADAIGKSCPNGVDIYFDNVGGEISDAVMTHLNKYARVPVCGAISLYNNTAEAKGPRLQPILVKNSVLMQGFIVSDHAKEFPEAIAQLLAWYKAGKLTYAETIVEGFKNTSQTFIDLFSGKNEGKMIVKI